MLSAGVQGVSAGSQVNRYVTRPTLREVVFFFFFFVSPESTYRTLGECISGHSESACITFLGRFCEIQTGLGVVMVWEKMLVGVRSID